MKRKVFGVVLLGLGAFLLVVGVLTLVWAPDQVKKTPLDVNTTTHLDGTVKKLNVATGELEENPVKVQSVTKSDSKASSDEVAVFVTSTCVVIDVDEAPDCVDGSDKRLVTADTDVFATDRASAEAVPDFKGLPPGSVPHHGLVNKWPFDAKKKTYQYWDGTVGAAVPAVYDREEKVDGLDTYVYDVTIADAPIDIAEGVPGTYSNKVELFIEPKTGAIQDQTQDQQRYLEDGTQVLDLKIGFTDAQVKTNVEDAEANMSQLKLVTFWAPLVGLVAGGLCLLVGAAMVIGSRRRNGGSAAGDRELAGANH